MRRARPESAVVWRFIERLAPLAGILGGATFLILALMDMAAAGVTVDSSGLTRHGIVLVGLCAAEAAGVFLLFRAVRQTVDLLGSGAVGVIPHEISHEAVTRFCLSPREREVAGLLTEGLRYEEIAARLFISTKTVKTHVHHLYEKTDSRNRMELANRLRA